MRNEFDVCIFGAGVIGLSTAYQLLAEEPHFRGRIAIVDLPLSGSSSWAGAGILPPPPIFNSPDPVEQLQKASLEKMGQWSADLRKLTGIDNGLIKCGGYYLAMTAGEVASMAGLQGYWGEIGIEFQKIELLEMAAKEPWLADQLKVKPPRMIARIPGESQLRNPRHLEALRSACLQMGAKIFESQRQDELTIDLETESRMTASDSANGWQLYFENAVAAAGAWTSQLLDSSLPDRKTDVSVFPVKGQVLLFQSPQPLFSSIVNVGSRYFVPRQDGLILVGSTEEEVGFDASATAEVEQELLDFVNAVLPDVGKLQLVKQWAGFRPASFDNTPIIGRLPDRPKVIVATGHFRSGIQFSIGTAQCVAALILQQPPPVDLRVFRPGR